MNLLELIPKNDPNIRVEAWDAGASAWRAHPDPKSLFTKIVRRDPGVRGMFSEPGHVRGLLLAPGLRVVVAGASSYWPNFAQGRGTFQFCTLSERPARAVLAWARSDTPVAEQAVEFGTRLDRVAVPPAPGPGCDLVITVPPQPDAKVFFGIHRVLDRAELYQRCKGVGVEVGPGPKPQILPGADTQVKYVEQATPDQWERLYGKDTKTPVDPALWDHYVVGNADRIPAETGSLDFIFSSHVIEHLANPLGHLAYWCTLLKKGGVIAAVIPDMQGCKDYVFQPSTEEELVGEYRSGGMDPTLAHYQRWCKVRTPKSDPAEVLAAGRSIHVHFYTPESMAAVLRAHHRELGYRSAEVTATPNHKDFFVLLQK